MEKELCNIIMVTNMKVYGKQDKGRERGGYNGIRMNFVMLNSWTIKCMVMANVNIKMVISTKANSERERQAELVDTSGKTALNTVVSSMTINPSTVSTFSPMATNTVEMWIKTNSMELELTSGIMGRACFAIGFTIRKMGLLCIIIRKERGSMLSFGRKGS